MPRERSAQDRAARDAAAAADRLAYESTKDAWHVWSALGRYRADEPLPPWIRRYLLRSARELLRLQFRRVAAQDATESISRLLQLAGSVANARQGREDSIVTALHSLLQERDGAGQPRRGQSVRVAQELADAYGLESRDAVYKIIRRRRQRCP